MILLKSEEDLKIMQASGKILSGIMDRIKKAVKPGVTTADLEKLADQLFENAGVESAFKGYHGYPASICTSVNNVIVHGIPDSKALKNGDIIGIDIGIKEKGFFTDTCATVAVGQISSQAQKLLDTAKESLALGIKKAVLGNRLSDISWAIQSYVEKNKFSVVREFVGHGIGRNLHEDPEIPNFGKPGNGPELKTGMVLAIEPMVNAGSWESDILNDGWTAITKDGSLSAHFEHTVAITLNGPLILT
ncbi:MAG: type I methionyl aminopeptidase [Candidatus Omnitrophica bacterium]|nr:type I methionyl aminopeptidase [Candidatus Omnitrophota bacterium]